MRATDPLALMVVRDPALVAAVDLHVGGVQIDGHALSQGGRTPGINRGQRGQRGGVYVTEPGLDRYATARGQPAAQPGRRRRARSGTGVNCCPALIGPLMVEPDQEVFPGQLRGGEPDQQLPAGMAAAALLDRSDRRVQSVDHVQSLTSSLTASSPATGVNVGPAHRSAPAARAGDP